MSENTIEGDTHQPENEVQGGGNETYSQEIPFPGGISAPIESAPQLTPISIRPNGQNILIQYEKPEKAGEIFLPNKAQGLEFIVALVSEVGKDCKFVKKGDAVILAAKAIVNGEKGIQIGANRLFFTQEPLVVAVVDGLVG